jgi:hypothetical protein
MQDLNRTKTFFQDVRWDHFKSFEMWDSALIQVLFSTHLGFGYHVTMGGTIYKKRHIFKWEWLLKLIMFPFQCWNLLQERDLVRYVQSALQLVRRAPLVQHGQYETVEELFALDDFDIDIRFVSVEGGGYYEIVIFVFTFDIFGTHKRGERSNRSKCWK